MKVLYETNKLRIEYEYEDVYLIDKETGKELLKDNFYGDPQFGLINNQNDWAIIAGEHLTIWTDKKWKRIEDNHLKWIHSIRIKEKNILEILTDPWSGHSSIWEINIKTLEYQQIKNFDKCKNKPFTKNVIW